MKRFGQIVLGVLVVAALVVLSFTVKTCGIAEDAATSSMQNAVVSYDEYQDIKETCDKLNNDLGVIQSTPDKDPQFDQFSKAQRVNAIKMNLNRWIAEYNAKSKHIDKKWWKSSELPYELSTEQFSNYNK
jgi:uncharacterized membrane protein YfbV (UPF0208 family)